MGRVPYRRRAFARGWDIYCFSPLFTEPLAKLADMRQGRTLEAADKPRKTGEYPERHPAGAKAHVDFKATYGTTKVVP
jgi:hypothetical protein